MNTLSRAGLLALVAAASASSAFAADLPRRGSAPVLPVMASAPAFSWTGFYLGAQAGYGFSGTNNLSVNGTPGAFANLGNLAPRGFRGGLMAGYNWQFAGTPFLAGVEGDINIGGLERKLAGTAAALTYSASSKVGVDGSLRARLGFTFDRALIYATGGLAMADSKYTLATSTPAVSSLNNSKMRTGYTVGAGVDYAFTNNLFGGLEYRYTSLGKKTLSNGYVSTVAEPNWHQVMARIGYKF